MDWVTTVANLLIVVGALTLFGFVAWLRWRVGVNSMFHVPLVATLHAAFVIAAFRALIIALATTSDPRTESVLWEVSRWSSRIAGAVALVALTLWARASYLHHRLYVCEPR